MVHFICLSTTFALIFSICTHSTSTTLAVATTTNEDPQWVTLASGRKLSSSSLRVHFPTSSLESAKKTLYEVTVTTPSASKSENEWTLIGQDVRVELLGHVSSGKRKKIHYRKDALLIKDGVRTTDRLDPSLELYMQTGETYGMTYSSRGEVINVWSNNNKLNLIPLDRVNHPSVFVNSVPHRNSILASASSTSMTYFKDGEIIEEDPIVKAPTTPPSTDSEDDNASNSNPTEETIYVIPVKKGQDYALIKTGGKEQDDTPSTRIMGGKRLSSNNNISTISTTTRQACSSYKETEIAAAFSSRLCKGQSEYDATTQDIISMVARASEPYEAQLCVRLVVNTFDGYCTEDNDPYRNYGNQYVGDPELLLAMLGAFRQFWRDERSDVDRDTAHFFTGFNDETGVAGIAYYPGMCSKDTGYGWSEGLNPVVFAHEVGHNFNADHDAKTQGIMSPTLSSKTPFEFTQFSITEISRYIATLSCLSDVDPTDPSPPQSPPPSSDPSPLSSPTPSASSSPPPSAEPSPVLPSAPPTGLSKCVSEFSSREGFSCGKFRQRLNWDSGAQIRLNTRGRKGNYIVRLVLSSTRGSRKFGLVQYLVHISTDRSISTLDELKQYTSVIDGDSTGNKNIFKVVVPVDSLDLQPGSSSCCGDDLFIYVYTRLVGVSGVTIAEEDQKNAVRFSSKIKCKVCNSKKPVHIQMSSSRRCPKCQRE